MLKLFQEKNFEPFSFISFKTRKYSNGWKSDKVWYEVVVAEERLMFTSEKIGKLEKIFSKQ
jgi:hypothetical protein